ncbi:MAG TPA: proton-conducting transporter membrane subunit [Candidatus Limnocylindrales bacterium]
MSSLVAFLIAFPLVMGAVLLLVTRASIRNPLVLLGGAAIIVASIATVVTFGNGDGIWFGLPNGIEPGYALLAAEIAMTAFIVVIGLANRRFLAPGMALVQLGIALWLELTGRMPEIDAQRLFYFDRLSMVMVLIIGVIGTLICINSLGYMKDYHRASPMIKGRRNVFFSILFVFLAGMFGLVTSNSLPLMLVFWEITTLCSFLLIGYTRTSETIGYAFKALNMNLLGGVAFGIAIAILATNGQSLELSVLTKGTASGVLLGAVGLLCLAGITKSAQMPFSSWLIGAMYAPSPTSALLHSSTMVKAGVFLLLRLSPAISTTPVGYLVAFVGLGTFLFVSLVAVTEQNTKKVLAYSTIGSLGLIVGCAGVGGPELLWVGVMIIIFHALAKGLLFLVVGTIENRLYTKDMENFDTLLSRLPKVSILALVGMAGMFIAPFGIVIAKWAAIRAFLNVPGGQGAVMILIMAFGSSLTIFYWGKLLIKVLSMKNVSEYERSIEGRVSRYEWFTETALAIGVIAFTALIMPISDKVLSPWAIAATGSTPHTLLTIEPAMLVVLLAAVLFLPLLAVWASRRKYDTSDFYSSGRNTNAEHVMGAALGGSRTVSLRSYYLDGVINGSLIFRLGTATCAGVLIAMVVTGMVVR